MNTNNESPAALLPCPLCGSSVHVKSSDGLSSILCESPSTCIGSGLGFMFIDEQRDTAIEAWNRRASTAPVSSENRGSVPNAKVVPYGSASGEKDYGYGYEKGYADGWNACRDAMLAAAPAPAPPAVSNEEGAFTARVVEWKGIRFGVPAQIAKSFMAALEGTNGEPTAEHWKEAIMLWYAKPRVGLAWDWIAACARELARSAAAKGEG